MREAMGGIPIFQIVIVFILLFTGIMCLTINRAKAYGVKDEIITIIETEGTAGSSSSFALSDETNRLIAEQLNKVGYRITGDCPAGYQGYNRNGVLDSTGRNAAYCVGYSVVSEVFDNDLNEKCRGSKCTPTKEDLPNMVYYDIVLFYQLDIPIMRSIFNFKVSGSTRVLFL